MKLRMQDVIELGAVTAIGAGVWLQWGPGLALLTVGVIVLAACILGSLGR